MEEGLIKNKSRLSWMGDQAGAHPDAGIKVR